MSERPTCIFLPGIIAPAVVRYAPLIAALGPRVDSRTKELELYTLTPPPGDYAIEDEVAGLLRGARRAGVERFHLYGHSAGGAVALAFAAAHPDMLLSLTLDEPAFDFSDEMRRELTAHMELLPRLREDPGQAMRQFLALEVRSGVEVAPPPGVAPLPNRPAGVAALIEAFTRHRVDDEALRAFEGRVLYTRGALSAERYERSAQRLASIFPDFREVVFEGLHHLNTSHQAQPERVASLLREVFAG